MVTVQVESAGVLEIFGPESKPWRVANESFLQPAIELAKMNTTAAISLAAELVRKEGIDGIVRFRCAVPVRIVDACGIIDCDPQASASTFFETHH